MANDIGWGQPYDAESGYGMAAVNGGEDGYGSIVISSYSGETNMSSIDDDNQPADRLTILDEMPNIYMDGDNMYIYYIVNASVTPVAMTYQLFFDDRFYADGSFTTDGINWIAEYPDYGDYYVELTIVIDSETSYQFTSNVLTI